MIGGAFGFIAYVFLFVGGVILIFKGNIQGGLYLLLVSSLFYIGKAIMYHGDQYVRLTKAIAEALKKAKNDKDVIKSINNLKSKVDNLKGEEK